VANEEPGIQTSPIRLTVEETKLVLRASIAGKPIQDKYPNLGVGLSDMGIFRRIEVSEEKVTAGKIAECWSRARKGLAIKDLDGVHQAMHDLERLSADRDRNNSTYLYELTALGKNIARGITVRVNGQR